MHRAPHTLTALQKVRRREMAESMLQTLKREAVSKIHFVRTGKKKEMLVNVQTKMITKRIVRRIER
jgi:hypothetical protein